MQTTSIQNVSEGYGEWKAILSFYKDELGIFKNRLTEIAKKNTSHEVMQQVEHFQNQFIIQIVNIDTLRHDINEHISIMAKEAQEFAGQVDKNKVMEQNILKDRFENEQHIFNGIKEEFARFLSKVL